MKFPKQAYWLLPILWGAWVIYLSLLPGNSGILVLFGIPHFDKVAHIGAYAVWSFLFLVAAQKTSGSIKTKKWWIVGTLAIVGCSLEYGQLYMHDGRSFELLDMIANGVGAICGIFGIMIFGKYLKG